MKDIKKIVYIFLLFTQVFWAQNDFEKGNSLYQKGNYQEAINAYESIVKSGKESAEVYFNLGNCYYKLNKVAPAVYNFEKALLLSPCDSEIQNNLSFAKKMAIDEIAETPKVGFSKLISDFTSSFHYDTWAWIAIVFSVLFLIGFVAYYFSSSTGLKRVFFSGMILFLLFVVVSVFSGFYEKSRINNDRPAIVFADVIAVKSEPNASAQDAFTLHAGTKVTVLEDLGNYKKIQLSDLKEGWIEKTAIKEIK
ncbi:tetratricopeptide repeat protein [Flavobacterium terrae]|uniref:Tetratricopeptide repeat-containing protein n=1 Tax=Flavobacterium terrae TaxID=415425 RepID=A0A1M6B3N0_9FLAO|nr:tetratricopeptide repeat protein [Flavobacterium terrae]SHI43218.1 Tetratricopeptide repeat-containing protein [Flavobacterium terrae]